MHDLELVTVTSGERSVRSKTHGETFHPGVGPRVEAEELHVAQQRLVERALATEGEFVIWDVGLGAAANAIAALDAWPASRPMDLHSFDFDTAPLAFALEHADELGYFGAWKEMARALVTDGRVREGSLAWRMHPGDFSRTVEEAPAPHAILYDPYSPASNPTLWSLEHFTRVHARLRDDRPCLLTSYSRSTAVRVTLLLAGFFVGFGKGVGEKDQTTLASNDPALLAQPLDETWMQRVRRSSQSAPLRLGWDGGPIREDDLRALEAHPQFRR